MFSEMLARELADTEGGRWAEYGKARQPITKNRLANLLHGFKVWPEPVWIGSKSLRGYHRHQFEDAWTRYLAPVGAFEPSERQGPTAAGTSTPFQSVNPKSPERQRVNSDVSETSGKNGLTDEKSKKPLGATGSDDLTFQKAKRPDAGEAAPVGRLSVRAVEQGERIPKGWVLDNAGEFYIPHPDLPLIFPASPGNGAEDRTALAANATGHSTEPNSRT